MTKCSGSGHLLSRSINREGFTLDFSRGIDWTMKSYEFYSHQAQRAAPLFQPPASWSWCSWKTSGPWHPLLHLPGTPASASGLWSAAGREESKMNHCSNCYDCFYMIHPLSLYKHLCFKPHHSTDGLGVLCKLVAVLFLFLLHPPLHLFPLHSLFAGAEGRSPSGHLVDETSQTPAIRTHAVLFIVYHLRSWRGMGNELLWLWTCICFKFTHRNVDWNVSYPYNQQSPPCLGWGPL